MDRRFITLRIPEFIYLLLNLSALDFQLAQNRMADPDVVE
jgi:hypothetical protein